MADEPKTGDPDILASLEQEAQKMTPTKIEDTLKRLDLFEKAIPLVKQLGVDLGPLEDQLIFARKGLEIAKKLRGGG